jgi:chaperonin cofactor prefoldin
MRAKTKTATKSDVQKRKQAIGQTIKNIEKTERKLDLQLKKLKEELVNYRWFMS